MIWANFFQGCKKHNSLLWNNFYAKRLSSPIFRWMFFQITGRLFQWRKYSRPAYFPLSSVIQFLFRNIFEYFACLRITLFPWLFIWSPVWSVWHSVGMGGETESHCEVGRRAGLVKETSHGPQPPLLSMEHFPAMTTVTGGGGGSRELLLPRALQNNLHFLECRKPVFFVL